MAERASHWPETAVCCFVGFAYADLPVGKTFDRVFSRADYRRVQDARCTITGVTQQFGRVFDEVPHGWKTICLLNFPKGVPDLIRTLPLIASWDDAEPRTDVLLSSKETWTAAIGLDPGR